MAECVRRRSDRGIRRRTALLISFALALLVGGASCEPGSVEAAGRVADVHGADLDRRPSPPAEGRTRELPNIILIIGDDVGYGDFGFMGSPRVRTPALDQLAAEGTVFTHGYATSSACRPSLLSLLTGLQSEQPMEYMDVVMGPGFPYLTREQMLPRMLGRKGYASFQGGKYWEGTFHTAGFDEGMKATDGPEAFEEFGRHRAWAGGAGIALARPGMDPVFDFLAAHRQQPVFLWFAPALPHVPHDAPRQYLRPYMTADLSRATKLYYANVTRFDDSVAALLTRLDELGMRDNSLIIYLSDNGWDQQPKANADPRIQTRRGKSSAYDIGFRTPIVLSWPGHIEAGVRSDQLVSSVDVVATLFDIADIPLPSGVEGRSLLPLLSGSGGFERDAVFGDITPVRPATATSFDPAKSTFEQAYFVRTNDWRYIWFEDREGPGSEELYRIREDPRETTDLSAEYPQVVTELRGRVQAWRERMNRVPETEPARICVAKQADLLRFRQD